MVGLDYYSPCYTSAPDLHRSFGIDWLSYGTLVLAAFHTAAALKHHFWDRNGVLKRMISGPPSA